MRKALLSVTFFNFLAAGFTFLINVLLARIFPYEVFGRINLLLSISAVAIIVFEFGFNNSLVIFYNKHKSEELDQNLLNYISRRYFRFLVYAFFLFVLLMKLIGLYYEFNALEYCFLITSTLLSAIYRFFITYYQALGYWNKYNALNVLYGLLKGVVVMGGGFLIIFLLGGSATYELYLVLYILYGCALLLLGVGASYPLLGFKTKNIYDSKSFNSLVLSLGLTNVIIALSMRLDNIIIERFLDLKSVAVYSAANSLALVFPLVTGSIMRVMMREISLDKDYYLKRILSFQRKYYWALLLLIAFIAVASPLIFQIVYGGKYGQAVQIFQILIIAYIGGIFFTPLESYFYNENSKLIFFTKTIQLLIFISCAIFLVQKLGLHGVAIAVVATRVVAWVFFSYLANKKSNAQINI